MKKFLILFKHRKAACFVMLTCFIIAAFAFENTLYISTAPAAELDQPETGAESAQEALMPVADKLSGYGLYIDKNFIAAAYERSDIDSALEEFISRRAASLSLDADADIAFANDVKVVSGEYEAVFFATNEQLNRCLGLQSKYAADFKISDISGNRIASDLQLSAVVTVEREETIAHSVRNIYTNAFSSGKTSVISEGSDGLQINVYECTYLDGKLMQEVLTDTRVVDPASEEVLMVGTNSYMISTSFEGGLGLPYLNGRITSPFGGRSLGYHYGIDIVALSGSCYGDDIYAVADGVVTKADAVVKGNYGKYVEITHDNGIVTLYAHMSAVNVSVGDTVNAGDVIGFVGSTGYSTGPHLHFEVSINGEKVDPELFVTYPHVNID